MSQASRFHMSQKWQHGFTLAELLIALVILGEIATFTIPKILSGQATSRNNAIAKEAMGALAGAYQQLQFSSVGGLSTSTTAGALTPYLNYVATDTASSVDIYPTGPGSSVSCGGGYLCLKLHSGALLWINTGTTLSTKLIYSIDPDGTVTGQKDSIIVYVYSNGRVLDAGSDLGMPSITPTWFSY